MRLPRFRLRTLILAIALSTVFAQYVAKPLWKYFRLPPQTRLILSKLNTRTSLPRGTMPIQDLLKAVKLATQDPSYNGIPIYVDPVGLQEAEKTLTSSPVNVPTKHQQIGKSLEEVLNQLGMAYSVKDGLLTITSKEAIDVPLDSVW